MKPTVADLTNLETEARQLGANTAQIERLYLESVRKQYPEFYKQAQQTARQATLVKSEKKDNARFHYWVSFADIPDYSSAESFWGKPSVQEVLKEALIAHAKYL